MEDISYRRIVVKVGSSSITHRGGKLNLNRIDHLLRQLVDLKGQDREVFLVTSGAIAAGMGELSRTERPRLMPELQGLAAIGQGLLMTVYNKFLREYGEIGAQILLTASDLEERTRALNASNTMEILLKYGVIPIINENDTVATQEIKFGDNDILSARVAGLVKADLLVILSDIDGLYNGNPLHGQAGLKVIRKVEMITPEIERFAAGSGSSLGTGGMATKLEAARICTGYGITMVIAPGYEENIILRVVEMLERAGEFYLGTTFLAAKNV